MLNVTEPEKALEIILGQTVKKNETETVFLSQAAGRINAADIYSESDIPPFTRATVDGYAVKSADTFGASDALPSMLKYKGSINMGEEVQHTIKNGECCAIPTGGMLPEGADSVVMLENSEDIGDEFRYIQKSVAALENVTKRGDDIRSGDCVIPAGAYLTPACIGVCASLGISRIAVACKPIIGIISTGDELVGINQTPLYSQIRDSNTYLLSSFVEKNQCVSRTYPIVRDNKEALERSVIRAVEECDAVLISGGSSAGEKDAVYSVLNELGTVHFHGLAMKPGKPTMFATFGKKCIFGLPGHPSAAYFVCLRLVEPALCKLIGMRYSENTVIAETENNIPADSGRQELIPVTLHGTGQYVTAKALYMKSGVICLLSKADGYIIVDRNTEGIKKGEKVTVHLI